MEAKEEVASRELNDADRVRNGESRPDRDETVKSIKWPDLSTRPSPESLGSE